MLATAPDALEADFQRFYGLNPDLIWTGELPANRRPHWPPTSPASPSSGKNSTRASHGTTKPTSSADIRDSLAFLAWTKTKEASRKGARWRGQLQRPAPSGMKPRAARSWRWTTNN